MKIAIIQSQLIWENPTQNRLNFDKKINEITHKVDLIVLPEMFTSGFSMQPQFFAETMHGETITWLLETAKKFNLAITGSLAIFENEKYYNRLVFVEPNGKITFYNKRHLFSLAGEEKVYTKGEEKVVVNYKNFTFCLQICYDLRFPVFSRNTENYDVLLYVANWPNPRLQAWDILLKARAVENMCYVIGVNCFGFDAKNNQYTGYSQCVDYFGNYIVAPLQTEKTVVFELDKQNLLDTRIQFQFLNDGDKFEI